MKKLILLLFVLVGCAKSSSEPGTDPNQVRTEDVPTPVTDSHCSYVKAAGQPYSYCVQDVAGALSANQYPRRYVNIAYYWHGLNGSPEEVMSSIGASELEQMSYVLNDKMPVVISLSTGPQGVISSQARDIVEKLIPLLESKIVPAHLKINRFMIGQSMGGFNTLRVVAEKPEMFVAAAALCPALIAFDPYNANEIQSYVARNRDTVSTLFLKAVLDVFTRHFPQKAIWNQNNPFTLLAQGKYNSLPLLLSVGLKDELGFYEGVEQFQKADPRGQTTLLETAWTQGHHCSYDLQRLAQFIRLYSPTSMR